MRRYRTGISAGISRRKNTGFCDCGNVCEFFSGKAKTVGFRMKLRLRKAASQPGSIIFHVPLQYQFYRHMLDSLQHL